jgi:hypothetical protein
MDASSLHPSARPVSSTTAESAPGTGDQGKSEREHGDIARLFRVSTLQLVDRGKTWTRKCQRQRLQEKQHSACDAKCRQRDVQQGQHQIAARRKKQQHQSRNGHGTKGKAPSLPVVDAGCEASKYDRGLDRPDRDEQRDEARQEA